MTRIIQISLPLLFRHTVPPWHPEIAYMRGSAPCNLVNDLILQTIQSRQRPLQIVTIPDSAGRDMAWGACDHNAATRRKMHQMLHRGNTSSSEQIHRLGGT